MELDDFLRQAGLTFRDTSLALQALTHRSYINEQPDGDSADNERLEFLGDAVLDFLVGDMLFRRFPDEPEGYLTRLRAALVKTEALAELSHRIHLGAALRVGRGEEMSGGRERPTNLCAGFEAVVGALYLDQGLDAVRHFTTPLLDDLLKQVLKESSDKDARSLLQEWSQSRRSLTPVYETVDAFGPDHAKEFVVEVWIGEQLAGRGTGRSKQSAAQSAAQDALTQLESGESPLLLSSS
ncbi:MAG: ribonuclease III [Anaerolineaceae bacterium]|nr:ribonuclease III [Anaerolineaceae bacterium]